MKKIKILISIILLILFINADVMVFARLMQPPFRGNISEQPGSAGIIDLADAILGLQCMSGQSPLEIRLYNEVNGDGKIGIEEVIYILQILAGIR